MGALKSTPMPFERSFSDPTRDCPIWAGPARLNGSRLVVLLPQGEAEINAPRALLEHVFNACDGRRSVERIVDEARAAMRAKVKAFVQDLQKAGVLTDASLFPAAAHRFAWVPSPFGNAVEREVWQQVPWRFSLEDAARAEAAITTPIDSYVDRRASIRTYGSEPINEATLCSFLWLLGGLIAQDPHTGTGKPPRRTIPSGGAIHSLRPFVVLRKAVGQYEAGVSRVEFPAVRQMTLVPLRNDTAWLPRAVSHPWYLTFATGVVFLVADPRLGAIKYRARAFQYLFIEAGAALQNAALAAPDLGVGMTVYGGHVDGFAAEQLGLSQHEMIVASAVFGSMPSADDLAREKTMPYTEFEWSDTRSARYQMPYFLGRCTVEDRGEMLSPTWGRDPDPWTAYQKSAVEAVERVGFRTAQNVELGRVRDWDSAIEPEALVRYADVQYRDETFPLQRFRKERVCGWVRGRSLRSGASTMVLAEHVYAARALRETYPGSLAGYTEANSSGCAAHLSEERALNAAVLELVERDAFMRSWLTQTPGTGIKPATLPKLLARRVRALEKAGCRVSVQALPSPWAAAAVVYAQHEALHFTVVGASARLTLEAALEGALDELETLAYVRFHDQDVPPLTARTVVTPTDHTSIYGLERYFRRADAVMAPASHASFGAVAKANDGDAPLLQRFLDRGRDVITLDIAAPNSATDQGRTPLFVVRAVIPGLIPISFGYNREPLGMLERYDPRARFPHPFP
jgi:ribosomal protein S12 methylthiotransferase accessory factor